MSKELVISASSHERRVAILEEGQLVEIYIEREKEFALVGSIYKGKVTRVLPGMQSAFVDIGLDGDAFLYVSDVFENLEDYDHGQGHGDAPAPALAAAGEPPIEVLPGETLAAAASVHEEVHQEEERQERGGYEAPRRSDEYRGHESAHGVEPGNTIDEPRGEEFAPEPEAPELEERQPDSNASAPQNFAPSYNPTRNYPPRVGNDRGPGQDRGGDRGADRGGDRGRGRGRGGRWGRRRGGSGGGDRDRGGRPHGQGGRNLPPSKYASPQGERDSRGFDSRRPNDRGPVDRGPSAPVERREDDIVLPGESLAKYRGRPVPTPVEPLGDHEPEERQPDFTEQQGRPAVGMQPNSGVPRRFSGSLPHWVLADTESEGEAAGGGEAQPEEAAAAAGTAEQETAHAEEQQDEHHEETHAEAHHSETSGLSEEELSALSSRLVEAKHEETQARAEADSHVGGPVFDDEGNGRHGNLHEALHQDSHEEAHDAEDHLTEEELAEETEHYEPEQGEEETEEEQDEREAQEDREDRQEEEHQEVIEAAKAAFDRGEVGEPREEERFESTAVQAPSSETIIEEDVVLLPGETRSPRNPNAPPEQFMRRDSARIGSNPRSRFQRPMRGGRGRDDRGPRGRHDGRRDRGGDRGDRGSDRGSDRGGDRGGDRGRGRFERRPHGGPHRGHSGHAPQRRPQLISEMLKAGQDIVVQIAKEPLGKKGARITSHVALPGRFLVYMPTIDHIGVSRKIASAENRSRLRRLVGEARGSYPGGFIVRTAAGGATDDEIRTDIEFLGRTWNEIKQKHDDRKAPALLHRDLNLVERILRDYVSDDFTGIWIDNEEEYGKVVEFVSRFQPKLVSKVKLYTKEQPIFEEFGIQHELDKALRAKVWLKSGGYIVINHTEALVAIDVNTGKFVGKGSTRLEDTIVKTNLEAVKEIVRQIRLRDLGGIIVVDFIDMEERRNREKVLMALQSSLEQDKAPSKALSFNEFGLVCITRKRTKQALERVLCQPCPYCTGSGMVKSIPTLCYEIQSEARKMATAEHEGPNLTLRVHPEIAKALKTRESILIDELEQNAHKHIIIQSDATLHWEQYDIY
jgi:ribonuclease G